MSFISNIESLNNGALNTARHNDTHSNDAMKQLLIDIYTLVPNAIIVETGVIYRTATTDFQAWATYYNPDTLPDGVVYNKCEILAAGQLPTPYIQNGTYQMLTNPGTAIGDYFCINPPTLGLGTPFADVTAYYLFLGTVGTPGLGIFDVTWQDGVNVYKSQFQAIGYDNGNNVIICNNVGGDPDPVVGTTGFYGITAFL